MSQGDTIETERVFGLPFRSMLSLRGIRLLDEGGDGTGAGDGDEEELDEDEQGSDDADEQDSDGDEDSEDEGFDGEFDAKRARRTIDRLRRENKAAKAAAESAKKGGPDVAAVQAENLRLKVALKTGLDDDLADRLKGSTEEELLEDAAKLLDRFYPDENAKKLPTRQPKPRLKGGSRPDEEPDLSAEDIAKQVLGR
jgi:hypothetical protein